MRALLPLCLPVALTALACSGPGAARAPAAAPATGTSLSCPLQGRAGLSAARLFTEPRRDGTAFVEVPGHASFGVRLEAIVEGDAHFSAYARVSLRVPAEGAGLRIDGWTHLHEIPLVTTRRLDVAPGAIWIEPGTPVRLSLAAGGAVRVEASDGAFEGVLADAPCGAVEVSTGVAHPLHPPAGATRAHNAGKLMHLHASPDGGPAVELRPEPCGAALFVTEERGAWKRVEYGHGLRVTGWVPASDVAAGEGPDCDDRHGGIRDAFDLEPLPAHMRSVVLAAEAPLLARPDRGSAIVGAASAGARLLVQDTGNGWARVVPKGLELLPLRGPQGDFAPGGPGLWIAESALPRSTP